MQPVNRHLKIIMSKTKRSHPSRPDYLAMSISDPDTEAEKSMKALVSRELYSLYQICNAIAQHVKFGEFKTMLSNASRIGLWSSKGLTLEYVPYILMCLYPKLTSKGSKLRGIDSFFMLDPSIQQLDDLWNKSNLIPQKLYQYRLSPFEKNYQKLYATLDLHNPIDPRPPWFIEGVQRISL